MAVSLGRHFRAAALNLVLALALLCSMALTAQAQNSQLFEFQDGAAMSMAAEQERRAVAMDEDPTLGPARFVVADPSALSQTNVVVPLPGVDAISLRLEHRLDRGPGDFTWIGTSGKPGGQSVLVVRDGEITGVIYDGLDQYSLVPLGGGLHGLAKIDHRAFPPDHRPGPLPRAPRAANDTRGDVPANGPVEVDVLGVYTPEAASANANIENAIQLAIDMANAAYLASNANVQVRLVGTMLAPGGYSEVGKSYNGLLTDITASTGILAPVNTQRYALGADLVALFVNHQSYCGLAWLLSDRDSAFSVTTHICITGHTFAHELGHNFGAFHDVANSSGTPPFLYGYGYIHPSNTWRTIQSYAAPCQNCPRIGHFSNPSVSYEGDPTGTVTTHDVARVHRERAATVAGFLNTIGNTRGAMTSPIAGTTLPGATVNFNWNSGSGSQGFRIQVGSTVGGTQYHDSGQLANNVLSRQVTNLPLDSSPVYVRLQTLLPGGWQYYDYTYTAATVQAKSVITTPAPGSTLSGSSVTFQWSTGSGVTMRTISVGSTVGGSQYHNSGQIAASVMSRAVTGLPTDGTTVHVRLWSQFSSGWQYNDYAFTSGAATGVKAVMSSPTPGSTITSSSATFSWATGTGVSSYWLYVGSNGVGSANILSQGGAQTSRTVTGLPASGTLYVRLSSYISGAWQSNDYTYTMNAATKAVMSSPTPGSTLTSSSATFSWTAGTGVSSYWLYVGNAGAGSGNILSQGGAQTSRTVTGLPSSGTLYVRLMSYISGAWQYNDYTYTMNAGTKAVMSSPAPGSTLTSTSVTFSWTTGSGASSYWLYVGNNGAGSANILSAGGAQTSRTVTGLPSSGTLNVRLMSYIGGGWQFNDYTYTMNAAVKAVMTWPTPGSAITNPWASFTWTAAQGSSSYWLYVGTNGAGSANILSAGVTGTTRSVTGLPQVGTLYVRLMTYTGGGWQYNDYTYTMSVPAMMSTPAPGSTLPGPGVMFQWTGHASIGNYWLYVGTGGAGSGNILSTGVTNTWRWVGGLPASGTVNVRLMSWMGSSWRFRDYTYTGGAGGDALGEQEFSSFLRSISLD